MFSAYLIHLLILICIYLILSLALQLAIGYTGLVNFGHIAFFGVGAYTSALLVLNGWPFWAGFLSAGILSALFGFLISWPTNKFKGDYLALATMGFSFVVYAVLLNWTDLTNGPLGIPGIPKPQILGFSFIDNSDFLVLAIGITIISYLIIKRITVSQFGKVLEAIRDDELAVKVLGKDTLKMKSYALAISAFFAGIAGSLYAHYLTYIDPSSFAIMELVPVLLIVIVGGLASLEGTILGTFLIILIPEALRFVGFSSSIVGPMRQILYALILLLILIYKPRGFYGKVDLE